MSAANLFVRGRAAYLMADRACYHHDGRLLRIAPKLTVHPSLPVAVTATGIATSASAAVLVTWLAEQVTAAAALAALPDLTRRLLADAASVNPSDRIADAGALPLHLATFLAVYDAARDIGDSAMCATGSGPWGVAWEPYAVRRPGTLFSPALSPDPWPGHTFDPEADAAGLAAAQRAHVDPVEGRRVGGLFEAVRLDAKGAHQWTVAEWPEDQVGQRIGQQSTLWRRIIQTGQGSVPCHDEPNRYRTSLSSAVSHARSGRAWARTDGATPCR